MNSRPSPLIFAALGLLLSATGIIRAGEYSLTIPYPIRSAEYAETNGLFSTAPQQILSVDGSGRSDFFFSPVETGEAVFVTVVFRDEPGLGLSLAWSGTETGQPTVLSENLSEGVRGWTQRTLRVPSDLVATGGILTLSGNQRAVARVRIDWLRASESFVAVDQMQPKLILGGRMLADRQLEGAAEFAQPDGWLGDVFEAGLQEAAEPVEAGISFAVPLEESPGVVTLRARFHGVSLSGTVSVWVNGRLAGRVSPAVPSLTDPGYVRLADGALVFGGWRDAVVVLPEGSLTAGENLITVQASDAGVSIRDATLQILVPVAPGAAGPADLQWPQP